MSVEALVTALAAAKAAHKANKADKALKATYKAAKKALAEGQAAAATAAAAKAEKKKNKKKRKKDDAEQKPAKKAKVEVDVAALTTAAAAAKAAYKADKSNKELKAAHKAAKAALTAAQAGAAAEPVAAAEPAAAEPEAKEEAAPEITIKKAGGGGGYKAKDAGIPPQDANEQVFVGNLNWAIDDDIVKEFFKDCGTINNCKWLEDKESGRFKGCGFLTFDSVESATKACAKQGEMLMDRELTINFAKNSGGSKGGGDKGGGRFANKPLSEKPEGCKQVFVGNLSFDIDDDAMYAFADELKDDVAKIRWLTDRESGDFKGCGFVEFYSTESVDKFVAKNGEKLMGRPIRIDYAKSRDR